MSEDLTAARAAAQPTDRQAGAQPTDERAPNREGSRRRAKARPAVHSPRPDAAAPAEPQPQPDPAEEPAQPQPDLRILESRVYRGPNYWSYGKAIHLLVDLGSLEDFPTNTIPSFTDDLLALLPGLHDHTC